MALSKISLKGKIVTAMEALGAESAGEHSWVDRFASAIADAVVDEITESAEVLVTGGSSSGTYKVQ